MAKAGQTLINKVTGEAIRWLETSEMTNGKYLKLQLAVAPGGLVPVAHIHPNQDEILDVRKGTLKLWMNGKVHYLEAGQTFAVPKGVPHQWWNESDTNDLDMDLTFTPALKTQIFFEQFFGLVNDDKTNPDGSPKFMQIMALAKEYEIYAANPPIIAQKLLGAILRPVAYAVGNKKYDQKYANY